MNDSAAHHILIVEDDALLQRVLQMQLKALGYHVTTSGDGLEGFEAAQQEKPDVILLDLMMPRMNGFQLLKRVKAIDGLAEIPVIILTASQDPTHKRKSMSHLADGFLTKPYTEAALKEMLEKVLGQRTGSL